MYNCKAENQSVLPYEEQSGLALVEHDISCGRERKETVYDNLGQERKKG